MKLLIFAVTLSAMAFGQQIFNGVMAGGTVDNPTIVNKLSKPIMGYAVWKYSGNSKSLKVVLDIDSIAQGALIGSGEEQSAFGLSGSFHPKSEGRATGYALAAVLFADGAFIGPDGMREIFTSRLYALRSAARDMQYRAEKFRLMEEDRRALRRAERIDVRTNLSDTLLTIKETKGEAEAEAALIRLANLPDVVKGEQQ